MWGWVRGVLLENTPPEWRIYHNPTGGDIDDVISATFALQSRFLLVISVYVYIIKRKLHGGLKI
jgi:hypothetical protein